MLKSIKEAGDLSGKRVLVRVDWNVPIVDGGVRDDFRIKKSLPTLEFLRSAGAKIIVMSHLEPESASLAPVYDYVKNFFNDAEFLENLRNNPGEKANDENFARELAQKADLYVNEAFSASHREHASIVGVPKFLPSYAGIEFMEEIEGLKKAFTPRHPFLFVLGGAKFETKLPLLEKFVALADSIFVGGALANEFFKMQGKDIGSSLTSGKDFDLEPLWRTGKIILPEDTTILGDRIVDAGERTSVELAERISRSKMILWNGPLGEYEKGYTKSTQELAKAISNSSAETIVGGADTLAAIKELGLFEKFSLVSTGGGAMLDFLANETLPGIEALNQ